MSETSVAATASMFRHVSRSLMFRTYRVRDTSEQKGFRALFDVCPEVCAMVWLKLVSRMSQYGRPIHLLRALPLLKVYGTESVNRAVTGVDEKTFRKWAWKFIQLIADMKVVSYFEKTSYFARQSKAFFVQTFRYPGRNGTKIEKVGGWCIVDRIDFRIYEPYPFDSKWYSHKFHGARLRYKEGVSVSTGRIVRVNGPFPRGSHSDLKIFHLDMKKALDSGEFVIADGGYSDERCRKISENQRLIKLYSTVRVRHETVNRRMKHFNVFSNRLKHHL